jgi:hypothetical protein
MTFKDCILIAYLSRYSDWLRAGRPRDRSSSPGGIKIILLSMSSKPVLRPTRLLYNGYRWLFPRGKSGVKVLQPLPRSRIRDNIDLFQPAFDDIGLHRMVLSPLHPLLPSDRDVDYVGVLIRCDYLGWAPLQAVLTELANGGR